MLRGMPGKPTDVVEDWTYGPLRWIAAGLVIGASVVGGAWAIAARRVPVAEQIVPTAPSTVVGTSAPVAAKPVPAPRGVVTELAPREVPREAVSVAAPSNQPAPGAAVAVGSPSASMPININTATALELEALPGIGPGLAVKIVDDRARNGKFRSLADLDRVPGIGPKLLEKMRPLVAFE
ncbi:MAG: ComEA family DNA-binding protein [Planctomycetes bacterium]|nr:ComEA family DNA-binding protein [Planctomycetota bacterium]